MRNSGQFFTAEVNINGKWVNRTYFPKTWSKVEIQETVEEVWKVKELVGVCGDYIIFQGVLQGHINIRYIVNRATDDAVYDFPMFDVVSDHNRVEKDQEENSLFGRLKKKVSQFFAPQEEQIEMTDDMCEHLKNQLYMNFRKIVVRNEMNCAIHLKFVHLHEGQEMVDDHYMGPNDSGQIPYFIPGTLSVWHENSVASADISDVKNEYIFTVHVDGSVTQVSQKNPEMN